MSKKSEKNVYKFKCPICGADIYWFRKPKEDEDLRCQACIEKGD